MPSLPPFLGTEPPSARYKVQGHRTRSSSLSRIISFRQPDTSGVTPFQFPPVSVPNSDRQEVSLSQTKSAAAIQLKNPELEAATGL